MYIQMQKLATNVTKATCVNKAKVVYCTCSYLQSIVPSLQWVGRARLSNLRTEQLSVHGWTRLWSCSSLINKKYIRSDMLVWYSLIYVEQMLGNENQSSPRSIYVASLENTLRVLNQILSKLHHPILECSIWYF